MALIFVCLNLIDFYKLYSIHRHRMHLAFISLYGHRSRAIAWSLPSLAWGVVLGSAKDVIPLCLRTSCTYCFCFLIINQLIDFHTVTTDWLKIRRTCRHHRVNVELLPNVFPIIVDKSITINFYRKSILIEVTTAFLYWFLSTDIGNGYSLTSITNDCYRLPA